MDEELLNKIRNNDPTITELILHNLSNGNVKLLAEALYNNHQVKSLSLNQESGEVLNDKSASALSKLLKHNHTLQVLRLSANTITTFGAITIAKMLAYNTSLKELYLDYNSIGPNGIIAIAKALPFNNSLQVLDLTGNEFSLQALKTLAAELKNNIRLLALSLSHPNNPLELDNFQIALEQINRCLNFNNRLHNHFAPITSFHNTLIVDQAAINSSLDCLNEEARRLDQLDEEHYLNEGRRLLEGLGCTSNNPSYAILLLQKPFSNPALQATADIAMAIMHFVLFPCLMAIYHVEIPPEVQTARYLLILYHLRRELQRSDLQDAIIYSLQRLCYKKNILNNDERANLKLKQLVNYEQMMTIAAISLQQLSAQQSNPTEINLLLNVLKLRSSYRAHASNLLCQSPTFIQLLNDTYPDKTEFIVVEDLIFNYPEIPTLTLQQPTEVAISKIISSPKFHKPAISTESPLNLERRSDASPDVFKIRGSI